MPPLRRENNPPNQESGGPRNLVASYSRAESECGESVVGGRGPDTGSESVGQWWVVNLQEHRGTFRNDVVNIRSIGANTIVRPEREFVSVRKAREKCHNHSRTDIRSHRTTFCKGQSDHCQYNNGRKQSTVDNGRRYHKILESVQLF
jgi:hypothetical protein